MDYPLLSRRQAMEGREVSPFHDVSPQRGYSPTMMSSHKGGEGIAPLSRVITPTYKGTILHSKIKTKIDYYC